MFSPVSKPFGLVDAQLAYAMTSVIPAPAVCRSARRRWGERFAVAVLFIGLAARGSFSYPRGLNSVAMGKPSPLAFSNVASPEKEESGFGRIATLVAIPAVFLVLCKQTSTVMRRSSAAKHGHGNADILPPVMSGLLLWVLVMCAIQQSVLPVPGLEGKQHEPLGAPSRAP